MRGIGVCLLSAVVAAGCGGPAERGKDGTPKPGVQARFAFRGGPEEPVAVLNGDTWSYQLTVEWISSAKEEVRASVSVEPADKGVTARVEPDVVKPTDEQKVNVTVTVSEAAASGDYRITLIGQTPTAGQARQEVTTQVPKKE
jgi:hypothetical protein